MSTWPSSLARFPQRRSIAAIGPVLAARRIQSRHVLWTGCLVIILVAQGVAITQSYLWAALLVGLLIVAIAPEVPLVPFLGVVLFARVLTDGLSSPNSHHTGSVNFSGGLALLLLLMAIGLLLRRRQGMKQAILLGTALCFWTLIAISSHGASAETVREGIREASVVAVAIIVCNSRGVLNISVVTRLIQVAGLASALLAIYQLGTHTGELVAGEIRSNGTFAHPDGAVMYFAIAATISLWRYLDSGRRRADIAFTVVYAIAAIATFSLGGLASLLVMLITLGALRPGSFRFKLACGVAAGLIAIAFIATPLGAQRLTSVSSTRLSSADTGGTSNTSLAWRLYKWRTLIPQWEQAPILGQGLGTTVTAEGTSSDVTAGKVPHNEYIRYLVETGAVGLILVLWAIVLLLRRLVLRRGDPGTAVVGALGLAITAGCLFDALGDNTLLNSTTAYAAAMIVAAALTFPLAIAQKPQARLT